MENSAPDEQAQAQAISQAEAKGNRSVIVASLGAAVLVLGIAAAAAIQSANSQDGPTSTTPTSEATSSVPTLTGTKPERVGHAVARLYEACGIGPETRYEIVDVIEPSSGPPYTTVSVDFVLMGNGAITVSAAGETSYRCPDGSVGP